MATDVRVERPEGRGSAACRGTRGRRGRGSGGSVVAATDAVARGRYWGGRDMLPLVCHGGAKRGRISVDVRVEWPERRRSVARRDAPMRRGLGVSAAAVADVAAWGRYWGWRGVLPLVCHGRARRGHTSVAVRDEWP